ncbi:glucose-1-phosphate adenylyltransferase [Thiohalophilus sp.]|uniref:glucose-1-phosphate adenylyltransferase n=1 Tax=Thiohalophilus sp. TaxID=3028392 RepID=UPI00397701C5
MSHPRSPRFVSRLTRDTLALIMAGGRGSRLKQLTLWRAKPAVPFGGKFRIIDFPLSNCINSGIRRIGVLTQYKAHSLIVHIQQGWGMLRGEFGEFVELLPAQQRIETSWYAGTADAIYQNIDIIRNHDPEYVLVLAGDHVYKMDYGAMLAFHVEQDADITVGCIPVPVEEASSFGVMDIDQEHRIRRFVEKPEHPPTLPEDPTMSLCSMGIYVFNKEFLIERLMEDAENNHSSHDFGKDVIPALLEKYRTYAYTFQDPVKGNNGYWRDVGTVDAFWEANMELIGITPELNLYDLDWPIWTYQEQLPPAKFIFDEDERRGEAIDSMVSGGCIISGATVRHSLLFSSVCVESYSLVEDSLILPEVNIGQNCVIRHAIIEKGCEIPDDTRIGVDAQEDAKRFYISPKGVVLVTPEMLGQQIRHVR